MQKFGPTLASKLNRRITIEAPPSFVDDGQGGNSNTAWTLVTYAWASIAPMIPRGSIGEHFRSQQVSGAIKSKIVIRYRQNLNISPAMRIVYGSRIYNIRDVIVPNEARVSIEMQCEELQSAGSVV